MREREREREREITYSYYLHFARVHARTHIPMDVPKFQERFNGMICTLQLKKYIEINHYNIKFSHLFLNMSSFSDNMNFSIFR